jgi:periplasmic nitrate reductase NapD
MNAEVHIASCVAFMRPDALPAAVRAIRDTGLAEVPRTDDKGRAVLLIERRSSGAVLDAIDAIRALDGVLAVHLAYQHIESETEMDQPHE